MKLVYSISWNLALLSVSIYIMVTVAVVALLTSAFVFSTGNAAKSAGPKGGPKSGPPIIITNTNGINASWYAVEVSGTESQFVAC